MTADNDNNSWSNRPVDGIIPNRPSDRQAYEKLKPPETHTDLRLKAWEKQQQMLLKRKWVKNLVEEVVELAVNDTNRKLIKTGLPLKIEAILRDGNYQLLLRNTRLREKVGVSKPFKSIGLTAEMINEEIETFLATIHLEDL